MTTKEFEIARLLTLRAAKAGEIEAHRGYAWSRRIFPLNPTPLEEVFELDFRVGRADVDKVLQAIEKKFNKNEEISFYNDVESPCGGKYGHGIDRMDIIAICRMGFLYDLYNKKVWKDLTKAGSGPAESQGMADKFDAAWDLDI